MARSYRSGDRSQAFLLPPDMREWLPSGHLAWLVIDVVAQVDTSAFHARARLGGAGRAPVDPEVLVALLVYAYCAGERSSRRIERLCETDVGFRVVAANLAPDHSTIARFRQAHGEAFVGLFTAVLAVCARAGMVSVGTVSLDGTRIRGNASRRANRTRAQLRAEVEAIVADAESVDAAEDALFGDSRGDEVPVELRDADSRRRRIRECLAQLDDAAKPRRDAADRQLARAQAWVDIERGRRAERERRWRARADAAAQRGSRPPANRPAPDGNAFERRARESLTRAEAARDKAADVEATTSTGRPATRNITDPDCRQMVAHGRAFPGYNAQAAVTADQVIVAADVTSDASDAPLFVPMLNRIVAILRAAGVVDEVGVVLADAGYWSAANATAPGPDRLIVPQPPRPGTRTSDPTTDAVRATMTARLADPDGHARFALRGRTVEPVFGQIKHNRRFDRFLRRGLAAVKAEWHLTCLTHNLLALHRTAATPA